MTLDALIMLAGFLVAALPFLGFPIATDNVLLVALGVFVILLGILVRRRLSRASTPHSVRESISQGTGEDTTPRDRPRYEERSE